MGGAMEIYICDCIRWGTWLVLAHLIGTLLEAIKGMTVDYSQV